MFSLGFLAGLSFLICFLLTPLVRNALNRAGIVDRPDKNRKLHEHPIPRLGGVPIMVSTVSSLAIFAIVPFAGSEVFRAQWPTLLRILPAATLVFLIGAYDDVFDLQPWQKLVGEILAAGWIYWQGIRIETLFGIRLIDLYWLSVPVTLLWLVGCANAFNLIDGMDGLASGVGLFATCTMLIGALLPGFDVIALGILTAPLAGALLAFLRFNFNPASMFLGDSGSLTIGFLLGAYGILWSQKSVMLLGMTAPLLALAFPILEAGISVARRFLRGDPIFAADRGHIHNKLLDLGLTPRRAVLLIYVISGLLATISLLSTMPAFRSNGLVIIIFSVVSWIGVQHLGYAEFSEARKIILGGTVRRLIANQTKLNSYRHDLEGARSMSDCWVVTVEAMRDLGFDRTRLVLPGGTQLDAWLHSNGKNPAQQDCWTLKIPFGDALEDGWLEVCRHVERGEGYLMLHLLIQTVREVFPQKIRVQVRLNAPATVVVPSGTYANTASASF